MKILNEKWKWKYYNHMVVGGTRSALRGVSQVQSYKQPYAHSLRRKKEKRDREGERGRDREKPLISYLQL